MRELRKRAEPALRILCLILAGFVLYELIWVGLRWNPFHGVKVPQLPTLTLATNNPTGGAHGTNLVVTSASKGTNGPAHSLSTNSTPHIAVANTNPVSAPMPAGKGTNSMAQAEMALTSTNAMTNAMVLAATNVLVAGQSNSAAPASSSAINAATNVIVHLEAKPGGTNSPPVAMMAMVSTNGGTNILLAAAAKGTNAAARSLPGNSPPGGMMPPGRGGAMPPGMMPPGMTGMDFGPAGPGKRGADLPPAVQARISRITDSEILGPVVHPMPMALMGIAGQFAFLRSANGQTGLVKEGDSLDDIKLLRIGVNRVLIEQNGQKKELMIFSGYGGDSLLQNDSTNENKHL